MNDRRRSQKQNKMEERTWQVLERDQRIIWTNKGMKFFCYQFAASKNWPITPDHMDMDMEG